MPDVRDTSPDAGRPRPVDTTTPSVARIYDYLLDGKDNFQVDRDAAEEVESRLPAVRHMMRENRAFLRRVVHFLAGECGIRQFIDIGSGLPTQGNVHEIAQKINADARVVYVDNDPIVLAHGRALLATNGRTRVITADLRQPASILDNPLLRELIDPNEPVAVLMIAILHFIPDEENPGELVKAFRSWMAAGSYLALSHVDHTPQVASAAEVYERTTSTAVPRSREEVEAFFGEYELVAPGLVQVPEWRPELGQDVPWWGAMAPRLLQVSALQADAGHLRQQNVPWWGGVARHPAQGVTDV
jgi:S-adenosyl methyltransferase